MSINTQSTNSKTNLTNISRLHTAVGTFRVLANNENSLALVNVEILSTDGWEALVIETNTHWYQTLLTACEQHLREQST
ncbi:MULTISPECIES: hypothetical protein [Shewanella]|uniref:hypothetical protein n=1 Tax=Shewanella TaxID=22 RepID=UPI00200F547C|nr:hypothetical protein [Shewanella basaltis]MCL1115120.1 hypothetical protein [Shewanella basaltis]